MRRKVPRALSLCMMAGIIAAGTQGMQAWAAETEVQTELAEETAVETETEAETGTDETDTAAETETETIVESETETTVESETDDNTSMAGDLVFAQCDDYINVRTGPNTDSEVTAKMYNYDSATILGQEGDWYEIQSGNAHGYVKAEYFATGEEADAIAEEVAYNVATVQAKELNVRDNPDTESGGVIDVAYSEDELEVVAREGDWMKVALGNDVYGYINAYYVRYDTYYPTAETLEEEAARLEAEAAQAEAYSESTEETFSEETETIDVQEDAYTETEPVYIETEPVYTETEPVYTETEPVYTETEPVYTGTEPVYTETEPVYTETEPVYTETEPVYTETEPVYTETEPVYTETEPVYTETEPVYTETEPVYTETEPVYTETEPVYTETEPVYTETEPVYTETEPVYTETEPVYTETEAPSTDSSLGQQIASFAQQYVGGPYVWGGTSLTEGADCSGFTQSVFANFGIGIARVAADQAAGGTAVSTDSIQPGDLLFYSSSGSIDHVAIYIGDGMIVHAANSNSGITTSSAYYSTIVAARRYW